MKKLFAILNIFLTCAILAAATFFCINNAVWLKWITGLGVLLLAGANLTYVMLKKRERKWQAIFMASALILAFLGYTLVGFTAVWCMILFALSAVLLFLTQCISEKFNLVDLIYGACVGVFAACLVIFGKLMGFANTGVEILVIMYILIFSMLLGKSFSNLTKSKEASRVLEFVGSLFLFIANFVLLCFEFSNISHYVYIVFVGLFVISQILYALSILLYKNKTSEEKVLARTQISKNKWGFVATSLVMLFITYATALTFHEFNIATAKISKEQFLEMVGDNLNIPIIEINTEHSEFPTSKEKYVNASFSISNQENPEDNFSVQMAKNYGDENSVGIRLRGNSTRKVKKKPFRIKFDEKQSFFGLKKNKSWVLLADYFDQSYMRNHTAFSIAKNFDNLDFTPSPHHVALILNGDFQGLYLLCEQVDENKGRANVKEDFDVNTDTDFPFLVEMDNLAHNEGETGVDNFYVPDFYPVEIKYPEADERGATESSDKVFDYIQEYINAVFHTLKTGGTTNVSFRTQPVCFEDLVDIDSVVDYYLLTEIMHNPDSVYKSIYFHKTKDGKMKFGPIWDYDFSLTDIFDLPYKESRIESANELFVAKNSLIFRRLLLKELFYIKVKARYNELSYVLLQVAENIKTYKTTIDSVAIIDAKMWYGETGHFEYDMQYDYVRLYLKDRHEFLNSAFSKSHEEFATLI